VKHTITVLQDDIDNGKPGSPGRCAIALAAKRELFLDDVYVNGRSLMTETEHAAFPLEAIAFVSKFDTRCPVEPFKFEIDLQPRISSYQALVMNQVVGGYEPFKSFDSAVVSSLFKVYAQHTAPFVPKYTASVTNKFVSDKIPPFAQGGLITKDTP
jgi:hypothetical protein